VPELRERLLYPRAGWLSLGLLVVMALALAWSVQGAGWLEQMDYLVPLGIWAVVVGGLLGMVRGTIVATIPIGAVTGAALLIWMIGGEYYTAFDEVTRLLVLRGDLIDWTAIVVRTGYPAQMSPYALGLGILMWSTAFTAAYAVFRYHRVLDAILLMGAALIANMSATLTDLFGHLLLFVVAALLLWLRSSLVSRQDGWQRRRVNETLEVPPAIMRSGIIVAGLSVVLAWALTSVAVAAPLTGAWRNLDGVWTEVRDQFEGVFGGLTNPEARISGSSFGSSFIVSGDWVSNDAEVLVLAAERPYYLRTVTYDEYTGRGFSRSDGPRRGVAAGNPLFTVRSSERPTVDYAVELERVAVEMRQTIGRQLFTAGSPLQILAPVIIHEPNALPLLGGIESPNALSAGESYEMAVLISEATEAQLGSAGTVYPQAVRDLYLDTSGITDRVAALAREITADAENPYEQARALTRYFREASSRTRRAARRCPEMPTSSIRSSSPPTARAATASTTPRRWSSWRAPSACRRGSRSDSRPVRRPGMGCGSSARRTPTPGPRSTSRATGGRSSRPRSRSTRDSSVPRAVMASRSLLPTRDWTSGWATRSNGSAFAEGSTPSRPRIWCRGPSIPLPPRTASPTSRGRHDSAMPSSWPSS
jgi:hypothetical protein